MLKPEAVYHTGFWVRDLAAQAQALTAALGVAWAPVRRYDPLRLWSPEKGWIDVRMRAVYSRRLPHLFELIEGDEPGGFFDPAGVADNRHIGVWTDDVGAEVLRLQTLGWRVIGAKGAPEENYGTMAYMLPNDGGPMIELVSTAMRPMLDAWFDAI